MTEGGAILKQCGGFGVPGRSGRQFLAFNAATYARAPESVVFDNPSTRVKCYVADRGGNTSTFGMIGRRDGHVVDRSFTTGVVHGYAILSVSAANGMDSVVIKASTSGGTFVVDDLVFIQLAQSP